MTQAETDRNSVNDNDFENNKFMKSIILTGTGVSGFKYA